jgi:hypothetical protein
LRRGCLLQHAIQGKREGRIEVTRRQRRRHKKLLDDFKETREYWKLIEETVDCPLWRTRFESGYGPAVREITE